MTTITTKTIVEIYTETLHYVYLLEEFGLILDTPFLDFFTYQSNSAVHTTFYRVFNTVYHNGYRVSKGQWFEPSDLFVSV